MAGGKISNSHISGKGHYEVIPCSRTAGAGQVSDKGAVQPTLGTVRFGSVEWLTVFTPWLIFLREAAGCKLQLAHSASVESMVLCSLPVPRAGTVLAQWRTEAGGGNAG